jgi:hypothetical protein
MSEAMRAHSETVASEVLATGFNESADALEFAIADNEIGLKLTFKVA